MPREQTPRKTPFEIAKAWREWQRRGRFLGLERWRPVKSEVHLLSMLGVKARRHRLTHEIRQRFHLRMRGAWVGPLLFEERYDD